MNTSNVHIHTHGFIRIVIQTYSTIFFYNHLSVQFILTFLIWISPCTNIHVILQVHLLPECTPEVITCPEESLLVWFHFPCNCYSFYSLASLDILNLSWNQVPSTEFWFLLVQNVIRKQIHKITCTWELMKTKYDVFTTIEPI